MGAFQLFQQAEALAGDFIDRPARRAGKRRLRAKIVPSGENDRIDTGKAGQIAAPAVEVARMSQNNEQSARRLPVAGAPG